MRKLLLACILGALLIPGAAFADHNENNCSYAAGDEVNQNPAANVNVHADSNGNGGTTGTADQSVGVCEKATPFGGDFEAGHSASKGSKKSEWWGLGVHDGIYLIADGQGINPDPSDGYAGISNYETNGTTTEGSCVNNSTCSGSNSGGEVAVNGQGTGVYTPLACGNTTGDQWDNSKRNGCEYP